MMCIVLIVTWICFHSVAAQFDNKILQAFEDATENTTISESCQEVLQLYVENLESRNDTWALRMLDATSKIPVGILTLNMGELGQFSQCLATESEDGSIKGKYCLGSLPLSSITSVESDIFDSINTAESQTLILQQKAQRISEALKTVSIFAATGGDTAIGMPWAICLPSNCSDEDAGEILNNILQSKSASCQTKEELHPPLTDGAIATIVVLSFFAFLLVVSTAVDLYYKYANKKSPHEILMAFSVYSNGSKLFQISKNSNELTCLNGIRFISMLWVIIGHVYTIHMESPLVNFLDFLQWLDTLRSMVILGGTLAVDTFLFLSGLLLVYSYIKAKHRGVKFNILQFYIHRYLRLTPALAATVLVTSYLIRYMGTGPVWNNILQLEDTCRKYWWTTLLYVQNYANKDMTTCLPQTWYLSVDMQLYVLSPLVLIPLSKYPKVGVTIIFAGIATFIIVPFCVAYVYKLPGIMTNFQNPALADLTKYYTKTHTRAAPWFIGLLTGYILATMKFQGARRHFKLNKILIVLCWGACISVGMTCVLGGHSTLRTAEYDKWGNSFYIALVRPSWAVCLAWVVFACVNGYGGPIDWFLSFPIYQVLNKFTYSIYILHYTLMYVIAYSTRFGYYFDELQMAYWFWGITMFTFALSVLWVLAFESPIIIIEKCIFGGSKRGNKEESNDHKNAA